MVVLTVTILLLTIICWCYYQQVQKIYKFLDKFPGPPTFYCFGNVAIKSSSDVLEKLSQYQNQYGDIFKIYGSIGVPLKFSLIVTNLKFLEFLLGSQKILDKSFTYKFLHKWLHTGLLTSTGEKWKQRRKIITPTFHFKILEQFVNVFNKEGDVLVSKLKKEVGKESTDIYPFVTLCTLDIICETAMGTSVNAQKHCDSEYVYSVKEMCRIVIERTFKLFKLYDIFYYFTKDFCNEKKALKILHDYTNSVIKSRRQELVKNAANKNNVNDIGLKRRLAFLDLLLESTIDGKPLSDEDIREEVDTFMFEGHDTTASAISFTLYCLANNLKIQQNVMDELISIFGKETTKPATYKDLQEMKYLDLTIKEALRLYPSVPMYARSLSDDLHYGGITYPKGLNILVFAYGIHRSPKLYTDPEKFNPERFLPENCINRSPYAYIPFSAGPRNCIGQKFAVLEMKATISKILRNFHLTSSTKNADLTLMGETVLKSSSGVHICLKERHY